jgi:hypothetical protein
LANSEHSHSRFRRFSIIAASSIAVIAIGAFAALSLGSHPIHPNSPAIQAAAQQSESSTHVHGKSIHSYVAQTAAQLAALPEASYNAVIPGLLASSWTPTLTSTSTRDELSADAAIYGGDRTIPVARLDAKNFLGEPTVVVPVRTDGDWTLILTPSRKSLPSASGGSAAAQTVAWIRTSTLTAAATLTAHIVVSVSAQTLTIVDDSGSTSEFAVGVGASNTPTPTDVTGYIQARYLDPAQGETVYPIQLTSLHSAAADEPFGGHDGGLIGVHYEAVHTGDVSHGCIRLPAAAITAVNALPLGSLITIVP